MRIEIRQFVRYVSAFIVRTLGINRLFEDVRTELQQASEFALALEQRDATTAAHQLTEVATLGVVLGIVVGALGMNVLIGERLTTWLTETCGLATMGLDFDILQTGGLLTIVALCTLGFVYSYASCKLKTSLIVLIVCGVFAAALSGCNLYFDQITQEPTRQAAAQSTPNSNTINKTVQTPGPTALTAPQATANDN